MIRSLLAYALLAVLFGQAASAEEGLAPPVPPAEEEVAASQDPSLDRHRTPVEVLSERMLGSASRAVRFDWRRSNLGFGLTGSELLERNNFGSTRVGLSARKPFGDLMGDLAVTRVQSWGTDSTRKLALTPYRQFGRPSRYELDLNVGFPLAEGVATAWPSFVPPTQLVLFATAGFRYAFYPGALGGATLRQVGQAVLAPRLTDLELENMEAKRPRGMQIDSARYGLLAGLSLDIFFQSGAFITPRAMLALPLLSPVNGTGLGWWWELTLGLGWTL